MTKTQEEYLKNLNLKNLKRAKARLEKASANFHGLQNKCKHPQGFLYKKYGSDTGNWDPHQDCYWTDFFCTLCGKRWTLDGSVHNDGAIEVDRWYGGPKDFPEALIDGP